MRPPLILVIVVLPSLKSPVPSLKVTTPVKFNPLLTAPKVTLVV